MSRFSWVVATLMLAGLGCSSDPLISPPEVREAPSYFEWTELGIDDASALAESEGKIVLVYAHTEWCGYCRRMDRDTWPHPELGRWISENAIAYYWNVDSPMQGKLHQIYDKVNFIPTVILSRNLEEIARHEGYLAPNALKAWLQAGIQPIEVE